MKYLLDTNAVSEWSKPRPNEGLIRWMHDADEEDLCLSVVTVAELRRGIEKLAEGKRKRELESWLTEELLPRFEGRILAIDQATADLWGKLTARSEKVGKPLGIMDAFLAASAEGYGMSLVTRDRRPFEALGVKSLSPWQD